MHRRYLDINRYCRCIDLHSDTGRRGGIDNPDERSRNISAADDPCYFVIADPHAYWWSGLCAQDTLTRKLSIRSRDFDCERLAACCFGSPDPALYQS